MALWPCSNPSCSSHGKAHPNCRCPAPMAEGGRIESFCASDRKHLKGCEYADGGEVAETPRAVMGHHVVAKGLTSLLKDVGRSSMQDPDKYHKVINEAKDHGQTLTLDPETPKPKSLGGKLGHHLVSNDHEAAAATIQGHPLTGLVGKSHLKESMQHLAGPILTQESHPAALRGAVDYLAHAFRGRENLDKSVGNLIDGKGKIYEHNPKSTEELKKLVDEASSNPELLLDVTGNLSHYLPNHSAEVAATTAAAVEYLNSIKPLNVQTAPLDPVLKPSQASMLAYNRQVSLAQAPLLSLQYIKDGTLQPTDIATLQTIYPDLHKSIVDKVGQQVIESTSKGSKIPYKMRSSLSMLLGQPLDGTMTQSSMAAIIKSANIPNRANQQGTKAPATALKAADKANSMTQTPLQKREITKKP